MIIEILIITLAIIIFTTLCLVGWAITTYNFFQVAKQDIAQMWSNILTEYQRRYDLFLNLGKTVKSYKNHEKEVMTQIALARSQINNGTDSKTIHKTMKKLDNIFTGMKIQFEAYPELKANESHNNLMNEIRITEDRVNIARTTINQIINTYNTKVKMFPSSIIANMFGFRIENYYEGDAKRATNNAPTIEL